MSLLKERLYKLRNEPRALQRFIIRRYLFGLLEAMGVHATADHFYEPIPNLKHLKDHYDDTKLLIPPGCGWNLELMEGRVLSALDEFGEEFKEEVEKYGFRKNSYFKGWDALCLYLYLRSNKIKTVVEVGQGFSTLVSLAALGKNRSADGIETRFISIDPYSRISSQQSKADRAEVSIIRETAQAVGSKAILGDIGPDCLLFVDSSHVFKSGSDVEFLMKEVYPGLPKGCHLHIHDIYSPYPWPKEHYTKRKWFWNEQDMLEQFMAFNSEFELTLGAYWLFMDSKVLKEKVENLGPKLFRSGASIYFKRF